MLKEAFDECFKFKIGDVLVHKAISDIPRNPKSWVDREDARMFVVERLAQECPGGIQKQYQVRGVTEDGHFNERLQIVNEIELAPIRQEASEPKTD